MTTTAPPPARCGFCRRRLDPAGPSQSFCDARCQDDWHATRNTRPLAAAAAAAVAEPEPTKDGPEPAAQPVDELHAWVRQLGPPLRPAAPIPPAAAPSWAARLADRCRALWARDRQETTP